MRISAFYICLVFLFLGEGNIFAQTADSTVIVDADTLGETEKKAGFGSLFAGKPGRAFLYSAILPGAGQAYNRKYWKVPIVYAALGTTVYVLIDNINEFNRFDDAYRSRIDNDTMPIDEFADILTLSGINNFRQQWRKNVQRTYITLGLLYLIQASEAFVDRHLMDFNVDDDLSLRVRVKAHSNLVGLTCQFVKPPPPEPKFFFDLE